MANEQRKSKRMVATGDEITSTRRKIEELIQRQQTLGKFDPNTNDGRVAKQQAMDQVGDEITNLQSHNETLSKRLEVETVEYLSGKDTDINGPTPREGLERAS